MSMRVRDRRAIRKGADRDRTWWNFYQRNARDILLSAAIGIANAIEIALLKTRVSTNETDIAALDTRVTTNEGDIATNATDFSNHLAASDPHPQYTQNASDEVITGDWEFPAVYFGDPTVNGTWRIIPDGTSLKHQRRESGSWVDKLEVQA
jgi:hypothetical protein